MPDTTLSSLKFKQVIPTGKNFDLVGILEDGSLVELSYTGDNKRQYIVRDVNFQDGRSKKEG